MRYNVIKREQGRSLFLLLFLFVNKRIKIEITFNKNSPEIPGFESGVVDERRKSREATKDIMDDF